MENRVHFTGFIDDDDVPLIYNMAKLFVFPSYYEGFGIPPLEAQACGTPVVCSNAASLPEVCANSVLYFDPFDATDMERKISKLINDRNLRQNLITNGFQNIKRFSWEKSAQKIIRSIESMK